MPPLDFEISLAKEFGPSGEAPNGEGLVLRDEAAAVHFRLSEIEPVWRTFDTFIFDFSEIHEITAGFAYALIGRLAEQHGNWIHDKIRIEKVGIPVAGVLQWVIAEGIQQHDSQPRA